MLQQYFELVYNYLAEIDEKDRDVKLADIRNSFALLTQKNTFTLLKQTIFYDDPLIKYFMKHEDGYFVDSEKYIGFREKYGEDTYKNFLGELGVIFHPSIQSEKREFGNWAPYEYVNKFKIKNYTSLKISDFYFPNLNSFCSNRKRKSEVSHILWNWLCKMDLEPYRHSLCEYHYYQWRTASPEDSSLYKELRKLRWICLSTGQWVSGEQVFVEDLEDAGYEINNELIKYLGIQKKGRDLKDLGLTEEEIQRNRIGRMVEEYGLTFEELQVALAKAKSEKSAKLQKQARQCECDNSNSSESEKDQNSDFSEKMPEKKSAIEKKQEEWERLKNASNGRPATSQTNKDKATSFDIPDIHIQDQLNSLFFDDLPVDLKQKKSDISKAATDKFKRKNSEAQMEAEKAEDANELLELFEATTPYSFLWFKLLMELQYSEHKRFNEREIDICFAEYEITNFGKGVKLKNPSKNIPDWIENAGSLDIFLCSLKKTDKLASSIIKLDESSVELAIDAKDAIKLNGIIQIKLIARDSINHIDSLRQRFIQLGYEDEFNLNENLNQTIEFIYGPPGTGKTTRLVHKLSEFIDNPNGYRNILVLTPTNKAADVIATKLFEDDICGNYLTRFGATECQELIEEALVQSRDTFYIDAMERNIVVTTMARYSYDCFQPDNCSICDFAWDLIVIDEASMIDIVPMVYALYKSREGAFIIAGDPKQIEPVTQNNMPTYNIYDMVELNSFKAAIENYKRFPIEALTTQHRSVPLIGNLVSQFAYDGLVRHDINRAVPKPLKIDGMNLQSINFVGFRTEAMDRLYGLTAIGNSPFHLYSAILTYNLARYMAMQIEKNHSDKSYSIGIVTPYGAQAQAVSQMEEYCSMSSSNCKVTVGTVHRFQGDECDIMLLLLNPPTNPTVNSHVNNDNIINVAMSRARDYLFFIMPQSQLDGFNIKRRLRDLVPKKNTITYHELEKLLFGTTDYIERNTNVTCHMPVNVYSDSLLKYEVRISDTALDIQIND